MTLETRFVPLASAELRATSDGKLSGYGAVFNSYSQNLGGFVEQIAPEAFNRTVTDARDVLSMFNHNPDLLLGSTESNTLSLELDGTGLRYTLDPPNTTAGRDVTELVGSGRLRGSSFTFRTNEDDWSTTEQGFPLRTLRSVDLFEVGPVSSPAYLATKDGAAAVALRSLADSTGRDLSQLVAAASVGELRDLLTPADLAEVEEPGETSRLSPPDLSVYRARLLRMERPYLSR